MVSDMLKNSVTLEFNKSLNSLAGYDYGETVYLKQIKDKIDISVQFEIVFPERIEMIASSFVQGLFSHIVGQIGLLATEERLSVCCGTEELEKSIINKLY